MFAACACEGIGSAGSAVFQPKDLDKEDCWNACPAYYYQGSAHACCAYRVWITSQAGNVFSYLVSATEAILFQVQLMSSSGRTKNLEKDHDKKAKCEVNRAQRNGLETRHLAKSNSRYIVFPRELLGLSSHLTTYFS